jgi:hypothetical protein
MRACVGEEILTPRKETLKLSVDLKRGRVKTFRLLGWMKGLPEEPFGIGA